MKVSKRSAKALQALVVFMAIALVATAIPAVLFNSLPVADAAELTVANETQLKNALADTNTTKVTLSGDITLSGYGSSYHEAPRFTVPYGANVELNLNGHSINWVETNADRTLLCAVYDNQSIRDRGGYKYVLIDNRGTLNVTGSGTLNLSLRADGIKNGASSKFNAEVYNEYTGAVATVKNSGDLTLGDNVKVNANLEFNVSNANKTGGDIYTTAIAVYQTGGSAKISGNISTRTSHYTKPVGDAGYRCNIAIFTFAYGCFIKGGSFHYAAANSNKSISVDAFGGFYSATNEYASNCVQVHALGIYTESSDTQILGANISCKTSCDDDNTGGSGGDGMFKGTTNDCDAIGVVYSTDVTPVIGSGTNISTFSGVEDSNAFTHQEQVGWTSLCVDKAAEQPLNLFTDSAPYYRAKDPTAMMKKHYTPTTSVQSYVDESGNIWDPEPGESQLAGGIPTSQQSAFHKVMVAYRYFDANGLLEDVVVNNSEVAARSNAISLGNVSNGRVTLSNNTSIVYAGGGSPKNDYFHKLSSITYSQVANGNVSSAWTSANGGMVIARLNNGNLETVTEEINATGGTTTLIYVDYSALPVDTVRYNINNSSILDATNTVAEVEYTGSPLVFGQDIYFNVYKCMRQDDDPTAERPYSNDIDITNRFSVIGTGSNYIAYDVFDDSNNKIQTNSLPSNPGTYTVKMNLAGETTYNSNPASAMNFGDSSFDFTLIIRPRNVSIMQTDVPEITYGQTLDSLKTADLNDYFRIETGVAGLPANGTFEWVTPSEMPEVGEHTYQLKWVSPQGYFETQVLDSVRVKVNKANLTVTAKNKNVTYGENLEVTSDDFTFAGLANKEGEKETVFSQIRNSVRVDGAPYTPGGFDAGLHSYALSTTNTSNYNITNIAGDLTIDCAPLVITAPAVTKEYDGLQTVDIAFDSTCIVSGLIDVYGANGVVIENYIGAPLANGGSVGQTTAQIAPTQIRLSGLKANNYTVGAVTNANSVPVNIVKAAALVDNLTIENTAITYDPTMRLSDFENLTPADTAQGYIKIVEVGDSLADGRLATPGKWVWKTNEKPTVGQTQYIAEFVPDDANYATTEQVIDVKVSPRVITVGVRMADVFYGDDQPSGTYTFSGFPAGSQERINVNGSTFNAVGFTLSGNLFYTCSYDPNIVDYKSADSYPIALVNSLTAENYTFVSDDSCTLTVKPKDLIITPVQKTVTYGTTLQQSDFSFTATGLVAGDEALQAQLNANFSHEVTSTSNVGEYDLAVTFANTIPNYNIIVNPGKIVVTKALITVEADDIEVTYGGTPNYTYKYSGFKGTDGNRINEIVEGVPTFSSNYSTSSKAGETFSIIVGVNGLSAENYAFQASSRVALLTVVTGKVNITSWPEFEVENGKDLSTAVISVNGTAISSEDGSEIDGTFRIDNRSTVLEYKNNGSTANRVDVTFYPTDSNYETVQGLSNVTVTPREISGAPTISGTLMVGEVVSLDVSTLDPADMTYYDPTTIVWTIGARTVTSVHSIQLADADVGKTVTVSVEPYSDSGFRGSATYTTTIRVSEGCPIPGLDQLSIPQTTVEAVYDKQAHRFTVDKADRNIGDLTVRYNGSTTIPTSAGTYIVTVDIGTSASGMYAPVSGLRVGTLVINPRPITVSFTALDKTYDGKTNAQIQDFDASVGIIAGDNVTINRTAATYNFVDANAGDGVEVIMNYAYLDGNAKDNYVINQEAVYASIFPKEITAVAYAAEQDYDENNFTVKEISFGTPTGVLASDKSGIILNNTTGSMGSNAAGSQDVTYIEYDGVLSGSRASNYTFTASNENTLKVNILQISDPNREYPQAINVSYSSLQRLDDLSAELPYGWTWDDPAVVPTVRVKTYSATYTPSNPSYKTETFKVVVNVSPVNVTIIPDNHFITYGAPIPTLTYTVEGFTGDDDVTSCAGMIVIQTNYTQGANVTSSTPYRVWVNRSTISNPNYTFSLNTEGTINVGKREYIVTPSAESVVYDPNNNSVEVQFTGEGAYNDPNRGPDDVQLSYTVTMGTLENNNAGTRPVTYTLPTLEGSKAGNYELRVSGAAISVQVLKAEPTVIFPSSAFVEFGQRFSTAVFDGGIGDGTFMFVDSSRTASDLQNGYYDVRFTPTDSRNYNSVVQPVLLQVNTADLKMSVSISGTLYEGQTLTAAISGIPQDALQYLHFAWYRVNSDGTEILVSDASTYELGAQDIGYYIRLSVSTDPTAPYTGSDDFTTVRPVEQENLTFWQRLMKWWYSILAAIQAIFDISGRL